MSSSSRSGKVEEKWMRHLLARPLPTELKLSFSWLNSSFIPQISRGDSTIASEPIPTRRASSCSPSSGLPDLDAELLQFAQVINYLDARPDVINTDQQEQGFVLDTTPLSAAAVLIDPAAGIPHAGGSPPPPPQDDGATEMITIPMEEVTSYLEAGNIPSGDGGQTGLSSNNCVVDADGSPADPSKICWTFYMNNLLCFEDVVCELRDQLRYSQVAVNWELFL